IPTSRPPTSTLFPYTTLFRSLHHPQLLDHRLQHQAVPPLVCLHADHDSLCPTPPVELSDEWPHPPSRYLLLVLHESIHPRADDRSEEHTSELQSRFDLVCRLL